MSDPKPQPCGRPGILRGHNCQRVAECSHVECPLRKTLTAGPSDLSGRWHFPDEDARRWPSPRE